MSLLKDISLSAVIAGFVTVLVGFTSSAVIVFQAAQAFGATPAQVSSWMWALCMGMGATCIVLSLRYKLPIVTAWSTPGAALLISAASGITMPEAVGAFMLSALLIAISGFSGWFERVFNRIPMSLASAMLAGVLFRFGLDAFISIKTQPAMVLLMLITYLLMRRLLPRYAVLSALLIGTIIAYAQHTLHLDTIEWQLGTPVFTMPAFSMTAFIGVALPLFIVTMTSQNAPGIAAMRACGYEAPISPVIGWTGVSTLLLAPFGAHALNFAAITAAICMGREAHEDPNKRYVAAVFAGIFYLIVGVFAAAITSLFAAFPKELILALAGIALLGTIGNGLANALHKEGEREPALIAFLVTASGLSMLNIGSAFWGLVAGVLTMLIMKIKPNK
ncbi:MAG: benzoate/H(+) symporter BenE family transporter [Arenimonas sp.]